MDYFAGSIKLMLITYAIAAVISFVVAGIIKGIFACIKLQKARVPVRATELKTAQPIGKGQVGQGA